eukprot:g6747.t1
MYDKAVKGLQKHLVRKAREEMEHLMCFVPGWLALGAQHSEDRATVMELADAIAYTCWQMYEQQPTGISPERVKGEAMDLSKTNTREYILRPEALEGVEDPQYWAELIRTAQLEVQGELVSLADMEEIIRSQNEVSTQDPILKDDEGREGRVSYGRYDEGRDEGATNRGDQSGQPSSAVLRSFHLKRPVPLASFAIHRPTARGFPPLRVFQAKHLQAQLELNAAQFLATEMQLDFWRKKVTLPESLRWHLADFGGEANLLEKFSSLLKHAPEQAELLKETLPELPNLGDRPDRLRIEYQEVQWTFQISSAPFQANFTSKRDFFVLSNFLSDFQSVFRTVKL